MMAPLRLGNHQLPLLSHQSLRTPVRNTIPRAWPADLLPGNFPGNVLAREEAQAPGQGGLLQGGRTGSNKIGERLNRNFKRSFARRINVQHSIVQ